MSCCDSSLVEIINLSGADFSVTASDGEVGNLHGLDSGTSIPYKSYAIGYAYSSGGTKGDASGYVTVTSTTGGYELKLPYSFTASNNFGACPCTAASQDDVQSGNYVAKADVATGSNSGEAHTVWVIISQPT